MQASTRTEAELAKLRGAYQAAWWRFSAAVSHWQSLQTAVTVDATAIRDAEVAVHAGEGRYQHARNALADYLLEHSPTEGFLVGSR
jgi:hypothetical protein